MKKVFKYDLSHIAPGAFGSLPLPPDAVFLQAAMQDSSRCAWFLVDPEAPVERRRFHLTGTGWEIPASQTLTYLGTFFQGPYVWHLFEVRR